VRESSGSLALADLASAIAELRVAEGSSNGIESVDMTFATSSASERSSASEHSMSAHSAGSAGDRSMSVQSPGSSSAKRDKRGPNSDLVIAQLVYPLANERPRRETPSEPSSKRPMTFGARVALWTAGLVIGGAAIGALLANLLA
jgi:hypothetical protein